MRYVELCVNARNLQRVCVCVLIDRVPAAGSKVNRAGGGRTLAEVKVESPSGIKVVIVAVSETP